MAQVCDSWAWNHMKPSINIPLQNLLHMDAESQDVAQLQVPIQSCWSWFHPNVWSGGGVHVVQLYAAVCHWISSCVESSLGSDFALSMLQQYPQVQGGSAIPSLNFPEHPQCCRSQVGTNASVQEGCVCIFCWGLLQISSRYSLHDKVAHSTTPYNPLCSSHIRHTKGLLPTACLVLLILVQAVGLLHCCCCL